MKFDAADYALTLEEREKITSRFKAYSPLEHDPWGASQKSLLQVAPLVKFLYEKYFRVSVQGLEKVPEGPVVFIANHGGQIPLDGLMVVYSLLVKAESSRLTRAMVERWVPALPFIGSYFLKLGQIVGDQQNCLQLLQHQQSVLVFPEGVKGSGKTIDQRYRLQNFSSGFFRLAIEAKVPIVPVTVVGSEETYPSLVNAKPLAKLFGAPYSPITPTFPFLGPLGAIPLPCRISLTFMDPVVSNLASGAAEKDVRHEIEAIRSAMQANLKTGLTKRGERIFSGSAFE